MLREMEMMNPPDPQIAPRRLDSAFDDALSQDDKRGTSSGFEKIGIKEKNAHAHTHASILFFSSFENECVIIHLRVRFVCFKSRHTVYPRFVAR